MTDPAAIRATLQEASARIRFSEKAHRYWLDGKPAPSVTTITKMLHREQLERWKIRQQARGTAKACVAMPIQDGEDIEAYADRMLVEADRLLEGERIAKEAANVGNELHALIEWHCRAKMGEVTQRPLASDQGEALFEQWGAWAYDAGLVVVGVEVPVLYDFAHMRFCGRIDLLAFVREELTVLDWKSKEYAGRLWPDQRMQNIAYRTAISATGCVNSPPAGLIVVVPRDGSPAVPIPVDSDPVEDWKAFEDCYRLYMWSKKA